MKKNRYTHLPQEKGSYLEYQGMDQSPYSKPQGSPKVSLSGLDKALIAISTSLVIAFVSLVAPWMIKQIKSEDSGRSAEVDYVKVVALENPVPLSRTESDEDVEESDVSEDTPNVNLSRFNGTGLEDFAKDFADNFTRIGDTRLDLLRKELITLPTKSSQTLLQAPSNDGETRRSFATVQPVAAVAAPTTQTPTTPAPTTVAPTTPAPTTLAPTSPPTTAPTYATTSTSTVPETTPTFEAVTESTGAPYESTESTETLPATDTEESSFETEPVTEPTTLETTPEPTTTPVPTTTPAPTTANPNVPMDEMELFYRVIASEAAPWWGYDGKTMIAEVIVNRVNAGGGSLYSVLTAEGQFDVVANGRYLSVTVTEADRVAAQRALSGSNPILPTNTLFFCTEWAYYNSPWAAGFQSLNHVATYENVFFMANW